MFILLRIDINKHKLEINDTFDTGCNTSMLILIIMIGSQQYQVGKNLYRIITMKLLTIKTKY